MARETWVQSQDRVIPKTQKMVLDTSLLNSQDYKVRIKSKVEQSMARSSALPYTLSVVVIEKGAFGSLSTMVTNFTLYIYIIYIYIYIYAYSHPYIRGAFNKFPDFFVQAFKIVIDSWKFSMLLLYIFWDDWPIFMISGSNEQLQQELEYTLLKPDCHSWWISNMQSGHEDTLEERYAIKFCSKLGKKAT